MKVAGDAFSYFKKKKSRRGKMQKVLTHNRQKS